MLRRLSIVPMPVAILFRPARLGTTTQRRSQIPLTALSTTALAHVRSIQGLSKRAHLYTQTQRYLRPQGLTYSLRSRQNCLLHTPFLSVRSDKNGSTYEQQ